MADVDEFLAHYGVKGMHWGVRRNRPSGGGSSNPSTATKPKPKPRQSADATAAKKLKEKSKHGGADSLSNKELQTLVTRMNLEKQYSKLNEGDVSKGKKFFDEFIKPVGEQELKRQLSFGTAKLAAEITKRIVGS